MDYITILGLAAGTLTTIAFLPQVIKTWKTKSTGDLSLVMIIGFCAGIILWLVYGILLASLPIILANAATFVLALTILIFKIRYR
ncbi:SemiSWEET transporter [Candidatus Woesearchaeota archaeon]|nr:SemiSWEET transporter [Candidatus Woesearchaeota archaeon]